MAKRKRGEIKSLFYITHKDNVSSILRYGLLSHALVLEKRVLYHAIYDSEIVGNRQTKLAPNNQSLWQFANVYFQARNPMMYRVVHEKGAGDLAVIGLNRSVLDIPGVFITDGNAANSATSFFTPKDGLGALAEMWDIVTGEWWNSTDGSKRKIMAECLVPGTISPEHIHTVYVATQKAADELRASIGPNSVPVVPEPNLFFRPTHRYPITDNLSLADGDMFFSNMQTLTVSVNVVGVMGKGLASRTKYQFPDVYVTYQDACRKKTLRMGKPYLYKREASFDEELVDEQGSVASLNGIKWFLLFATKSHWREDSDLPGIVEGLRWVAQNAVKEGIKSLAMPALGCGLGKLEWKDVGPAMCQHLAAIGIPVVIYLPRERDIPPEYLQRKFLLGRVG
jgi:O-acetyl-ADP-ribose deacetylase (regulator of RNase III)